MEEVISNEWVGVEHGVATIGITHAAQKELGDIVYVELPRIGAEIKVGDVVAVLESTKAAVDIYSPVAGTVVAVNEALHHTSDLINTAPEGAGWLYKLKLS